MDAIKTNWQTTLAGAVAALGGYFTTLPDPWHTVGVVLSALGLAALGLAAKQHNVTGGSVPATPEAEKRVAPKGLATVEVLCLLSVLGVLFLPGCATLSRVGGTTGDLDLGKGYICSATVAAVDAATCTREVSTHCTGPHGFTNDTKTAAPIPRDAAGACP